MFSALVGFSLNITSTYDRVKQSSMSTKGMYSVAYVMPCGARDQSCGEHVIGASTTTMLQYIPRPWLTFRRKTRLLWFAWLLYLLIWLPATSSKDTFLRDRNLTRALNTTSLVAINWRYWQAVKNYACVWGFKVASCKRTSLKPTRFSPKN
jgi:hypothetical protein